jgi:anti-sigma B factor antagonist
MNIPERRSGTALILSPQKPLMIGGTAEEFEQTVQRLLTGGERDLVVDLTAVPHLDSTGIRALIRGHTSAARMSARFRVACPQPRVSTMFRITRLDTVFVILDADALRRLGDANQPAQP